MIIIRAYANSNNGANSGNDNGDNNYILKARELKAFKCNSRSIINNNEGYFLFKIFLYGNLNLMSDNKNKLSPKNKMIWME